VLKGFESGSKLGVQVILQGAGVGFLAGPDQLVKMVILGAPLLL